MQEIQRKKNKVIDLRKKKITPVKISVIAQEAEAKPVMQVITPFIGGTFPCITCGDVSAQEFGRCKGCDMKHRQIAAQLDARPKMSEPVKIPPKLTYRKEAIGGVIVTISTSEPLRL